MRGLVGREGKHHFVGVLVRGSRQDGATNSRLLVEGLARCRRRVAACAAGNSTGHTPRQACATMAAATGHDLTSFAVSGDVQGRCEQKAPTTAARPVSSASNEVRAIVQACTSGGGLCAPWYTRFFFFFCAYRMHSVHMKNGRTAARWAVTESSVRNAGGLDRTYLTALARTFLRGSSSHLCWNARAYLFNSPLTRTLLLCRVHVMSVNAAHVTGTCVPGQGTHVRSGSI